METPSSFRILEHKRIPYAVASGNRIVFPEEALHGVGPLKCPACLSRVALTSVAGILALTHVMPFPGCPFSRRGYKWARPSAVYSLYGRIKFASEHGAVGGIDVLRRCYTCKSVRTCRLPEPLGAVVMEYDPDREGAGGSHPDIALLDISKSPVLLLFVAVEERVEIPSYLRKTPSFVVHAPHALSDSRAVRVSRAYAMPSPDCPCGKAEKIEVEGEEGAGTVSCPMAASRNQPWSVPLPTCVRCVYHLSLFKETVTCGFGMGIRQPKSWAPTGMRQGRTGK